MHIDTQSPSLNASTPVSATAGPSRRVTAGTPLTASSNGPSIKPSRLKLKIADSAIEEAQYATRSYDRDVDSDRDEPLHVEEQFILRLPPNAPMRAKIADLASTRELGTRKGAAKYEGGEPWFKFRDSRRAIFGFGKPDDLKRSETYQAKLVDLPCIVESHKTLDMGKHMFKAGDIVQMLVVDGNAPVKPGQDLEKDKPQTAQEQQSARLNMEEFIWDSGLTPPMQHVRKRRFRRRANRRTIEAVERMVESLIFKDNLAAKSEYELIDPAELAAENPPGTAGDGSMGAPTPGRSDAEGEGEGGSSQDDDDLLADLEKGLQDDDTETSRDEAEDRDEGSDSDMDGLFGGAGGSEDELVPGPEDDEEESPEKAEARRRARLLADEVRDLESMVNKKKAELATPNPIMRQRAENHLSKLMQELELKRGQLDAAMNAPATGEGEDGDGDAGDEADAEGDGGDRQRRPGGGGMDEDEDDEEDDELFGGPSGGHAADDGEDDMQLS